MRLDSPATRAELSAQPPAPPVRLTGSQIVDGLLGPRGARPAPVAGPGLLAGDVLVAIDGKPVWGQADAMARLANLADRTAAPRTAGPAAVLTIRRGLPRPYTTHPRLDLFVGSPSPHPMANFACTVCHEGQGSATDFQWASHTPDSEADRQRWRRQHGWFDNPYWRFPMLPARFAESTCLKCHHDVVELGGEYPVSRPAGSQAVPRLSAGPHLRLFRLP